MASPGQDTVRRAIEHLDRGEDLEALSLLGPYVLRRPDDVEALYRYAIGLARTGQIGDSVRVLSRVLEIEPGHGRSLAALGRTRLVHDDPVGAETFLRMAIRNAPDERSGWQDLGYALHAIGRNQDSRLVLHEAVARFPDDVALKALLLNVELEEGALEAAGRTADRIETGHGDELLGLVAVMQYGLDPPDVERASRIARALWEHHAGTLPDHEELLRQIAEAFPPVEDALLRGEQESVACPLCGARTLRREVTGLVLAPEPLARLSALGALVSWNRCPCGHAFPRPDPTTLLYPDLSLAFVVDPFPRAEPEIGDLEARAAGSFGEPATARPTAETWFAIPLSGAAGVALSLVGERSARERVASLPEIGELGRAERRARETITALRRLALSDEDGERDESETLTAESGRSGLAEWMRAEREGLLGSGIAWSPWPLGHRCACGADLGPFLFGEEREQPFPPESVDEAAIEGRPFLDPAKSEPIWGFNCDACGRLHTWLMGVRPAE